jgi:hypothetical protein
MSPHSTLKPGFPAKCLWPLFLEAQGWARCQIVHPVNGHDAKDPVIYVENGSIVPHGSQVAWICFLGTPLRAVRSIALRTSASSSVRTGSSV